MFVDLAGGRLTARQMQIAAGGGVRELPRLAGAVAAHRVSHK